MKLVYTAPQAEVDQARNYMFAHRKEFCYGYNNEHGKVTENGQSEINRIGWTNPFPRAKLDFPIEKIRQSTLPKIAKFGHGMDQKSIKDKTIGSIKLGDSATNAEMLEGKGFSLCAWLWEDSPENVHTIKYWRLKATDQDALAMKYAKEIRPFFKDRNNSVHQIRDRIKEINVILRNANSRFTLTDCSSSTNESKRAVQISLKTRKFDW